MTHIPYRGEMENDEAIRIGCIKQVTDTVMQKKYFPAVLVGDLNCRPDTAPIVALRENWDVWNDARLDVGRQIKLPQTAPTEFPVF